MVSRIDYSYIYSVLKKKEIDQVMNRVLIPDIIGIIDSYTCTQDVPEPDIAVYYQQLRHGHDELDYLAVEITIAMSLTRFIARLLSGVFTTDEFYSFYMLMYCDIPELPGLDEAERLFKTKVYQQSSKLRAERVANFDKIWDEFEPLFDASELPKYIQTVIKYNASNVLGLDVHVRRLTFGRSQAAMYHWIEEYPGHLMKKYTRLNNEMAQLVEKIHNIRKDFQTNYYTASSAYFKRLRFQPLVQFTDVREFFHANSYIFKLMQIEGTVEQVEHTTKYKNRLVAHQIVITINNRCIGLPYREKPTELTTLFDMGIIGRHVNSYDIQIGDYQIMIHFEYCV